MPFLIDPRSYNGYDLFKKLGRSEIWLEGYRCGFDGIKASTDCEPEFLDGHGVGTRDRARDKNPPWLKNGLSRHDDWR